MKIIPFSINFYNTIKLNINESLITIPENKTANITWKQIFNYRDKEEKIQVPQCICKLRFQRKFWKVIFSVLTKIWLILLSYNQIIEKSSHFDVTFTVSFNKNNIKTAISLVTDIFNRTIIMVKLLCNCLWSLSSTNFWWSFKPLFLTVHCGSEYRNAHISSHTRRSWSIESKSDIARNGNDIKRYSCRCR